MNEPALHGVAKEADHIQECLARYASSLAYAALPDEVVHMAKVCIIDTLGALIGGYDGDPCRIARQLAARMPPDPNGATIMGTGAKTTVEMAAFVNGTTARYVEANDIYHRPGSRIAHPSDVLMPVLAVAEHVHASGAELITASVLAYEVYLRIADAVPNLGVDAVTFGCLGTAAAAAKLLGLDMEGMAHAISMAIVPNNVVRWKTGHLSMYKAAAPGQAGREGVFAALLAREGMDSPPLPFEGQHGWCNQIAHKRFTLQELGGNGTPFKIMETMIKPRPYGAHMIPPILACEKIAPALKHKIRDVERITVEVYRSKESAGCSTAEGQHHWNPDSRETADHSIPYNVAVAVMDGTVTPASFDDAHLWNPELRALVHKVEVVINDEFTKYYEKVPVEHRTRVTALTRDGGRHVAESGGRLGDDLSDRKSNAQIEAKFCTLAGERLGATAVDSVLAKLWELESMQDVATIPPMFVIGRTPR